MYESWLGRGPISGVARFSEFLLHHPPLRTRTNHLHLVQVPVHSDIVVRNGVEQNHAKGPPDMHRVLYAPSEV